MVSIIIWLILQIGSLMQLMCKGLYIYILIWKDWTKTGILHTLSGQSNIIFLNTSMNIQFSCFKTGLCVWTCCIMLSCYIWPYFCFLYANYVQQFVLKRSKEKHVNKTSPCYKHKHKWMRINYNTATLQETAHVPLASLKVKTLTCVILDLICC